jgi:hypothetical protein
MWKNIVEPGMPQMTIWRMRIAYWTHKATISHSKYVIIIAFPLQQWFHQRASMLHYTYIACLVLLLGHILTVSAAASSTFRKVSREAGCYKGSACVYMHTY